MNISPTPKRYASRSGQKFDNYYDENIYSYADPIGRNYYPRARSNGDRLIPNEYKQSGQTLEDLVQQVKQLNTKLESKQQENERLNMLVNSLRAKLVKYTDLCEQYKSELNRKTSELYNRNVSEHEQDYIQVNKKRSNNQNGIINNGSNDSRVPSIQSESSSQSSSNTQNEGIDLLMVKMDRLYDILANAKSSSTKADIPNSPNSPLRTPNRSTTSIPSEQDILVRESREFKKLEAQVQEYQRRLNARQENEQRKISLQRQLLELQKMLDEPANADHIPSTRSVSSDHSFSSPHPTDCSSQHGPTKIERSKIFNTPPN